MVVLSHIVSSSWERTVLTFFYIKKNESGNSLDLEVEQAYLSDMST